MLCFVAEFRISAELKCRCRRQIFFLCSGVIEYLVAGQIVTGKIVYGPRDRLTFVLNQKRPPGCLVSEIYEPDDHIQQNGCFKLLEGGLWQGVAVIVSTDYQSSP